MPLADSTLPIAIHPTIIPAAASTTGLTTNEKRSILKARQRAPFPPTPTAPHGAPFPPPAGSSRRPSLRLLCARLYILQDLLSKVPNALCKIRVVRLRVDPLLVHLAVAVVLPRLDGGVQSTEECCRGALRSMQVGVDRVGGVMRRGRRGRDFQAAKRSKLGLLRQNEISAFV